MPDVEVRFACICYRDPIDSPGDKHEFMNFSSNVEVLKEFLNPIIATGGLFSFF
jgi:hypothetical protein